MKQPQCSMYIPHDKWRPVPVTEDEMTQPLADHFHPPLLDYTSQQAGFQHCDNSESNTHYSSFIYYVFSS